MLPLVKFDCFNRFRVHQLVQQVPRQGSNWGAWQSHSPGKQVWHYYKNFIKLFSRKTSSATLCKLRMPPIQPFTLIKNSLLLIPFILIKLLMKPILLCIINTFACLKINQYSTGLFVSYSVKNPIAPNKNYYDCLAYVKVCLCWWS
jgi:hypothetical protein